MSKPIFTITISEGGHTVVKQHGPRKEHIINPAASTFEPATTRISIQTPAGGLLSVNIPVRTTRTGNKGFMMRQIAPKGWKNQDICQSTDETVGK